MKVNELFDLVSMFLQMGFTVVMMFIELFIGSSVALFIIDGIKAKRQHRKRKAGINVMFIISIILAVLQLILGIYACVVLFMFLTGMAWQ